MPEDRVIQTSRPPTVVTFVVKVNGAEIPQQYRAEMITVHKEVNRIPYAKLVFVDGDASEQKFQASNGNLFIPGNDIEVSAGYESANELLFKGIIIKQSIKIRSNNAVLTIECKDKAVKSTIGRKNKYFTDNPKDSDAIATVLRPYGLQTDIETTDVTHKELVQFECTDWDFIVNRAEVNGKLVLCDDGKVTVKKPVFSGAAALSLVYGATILELDAEIDARHQLKTIKSSSWSSDDQKVLESQAADPNVQLNGNLTAGKLADVIGLNEYILKHGGEVEEAELQSWGKALWWKRQAAKVRGRVRFRGVANIKPGMLIELKGISDRINGKCFVSGVHHHISAGDWQTDAQFGVEPGWFAREPDLMSLPASGLLAGICGLQVGKVTQLEKDPDGRNRIKVFLPIISKDEQGFWARVATLDAGKDRGSFFLPEIGDEVIVGFINDDPRDAVVLGMMNSSAKPAPLTAEDANDEKGFVTRSKMKMIFNDKKKSFTLETPVGKKITVDEDANILKLEDNNGNSLVMDSKGISIESSKKIQIKAGTDLTLDAMNVGLKASVGFTGEGGGSTELKASGSMTIKGAIVQIN